MPLIRSESMFSSAMVILSSSCSGRGLWWNGKTRAVVKGKATKAQRGIFIIDGQVMEMEKILMGSVADNAARCVALQGSVNFYLDEGRPAGPRPLCRAEPNAQ